MWEGRSHLLHRCVLHEIRGQICPTCANNLLDCPSTPDLYLFLPPNAGHGILQNCLSTHVHALVDRSPSWLKCSDVDVCSLKASRKPCCFFYNTKLGTGKHLMGETWMNQIQLVSCKYRVDIMNMVLFCLMFTTECHLYYI